jgi:selenide,water dikinase
VYRLAPDLAVVQSVDLFPPVVDDPYDFGRIAAANSLSDIYAMGARPLFALSVVGFPLAKLKLEVLAAILRGGADVARAAGIDILGGHSIDDLEPKYGLVVTGVVHPDRVWRNVGARPGDALVLTKPLGTGLLTTAIKRGLLGPDDVRTVTETMATLNRGAAEALEGLAVHACTDVTGFGLLGHLAELVAGSRVAARVEFGALPLLPGTRDFAARGVLPGGTRRNLGHAREAVELVLGVAEPDALVAADAQTSGGLLVALPEDDAARFLERLRAAGHPLAAARVGAVTAAHERGRIEVVP